ncbi:MAG: DUF6985 domain-containing protein [Olsenella profusa]
MSSITKEIWGRELKLEIYPEGGKAPTDEQSLALERILATWDAVECAAPALREYCAKEKYCARDSDGKDADNVFHYVIPRHLFLPRMQKERTVALMCDCRFEPEHGLALVFENEKLKEVGTQDIIL